MATVKKVSARAGFAAYGSEAAELIRRAAERYRKFLALSPAILHGALSGIERVVARRAPWILSELAAVSEGASVPLEDVLLLNARSELISIWSGQKPLECTSVGVTSARSPDGVTRIAQNWDWITAMSDLPVILEVKPEDGPAYLSFCEAGQLAKISVTEDGLAVGINFLSVPPHEARLAQEGLPVHLLVRSVLRARSVAEAIAALESAPRGGCAHFLLADPGGRVASVEVRPSRVDVIEPGADGLVTHANDFEARAPRRPCRSERLAALLAGRETGRENLLEALRDHDESAPEQICSHAPSPIWSSSIASIVLECAPPRLWVAKGLPCERHSAVAHGFAPTRSPEAR